MLIQCSKKLLEQLKMKPTVRIEEEPLFSWHAHLITINRRKTVVLMNDLNRYVIVLHGLKAKDFNGFDDVIIQGIRETLLEEGIKGEVVERFILHSPEISYYSTKDRTLVNRMNKACENVTYFDEFLDNDSIFNTKWSTRVSRILVGEGKNSYFSPNERLYKDISAFVNEPIFSTKAVKMKVALNLGRFRAWRTIVMPTKKTFQDLHEVLQIAFGWKDYHLHEFYIYDETGKKPFLNLVCDEEAFSYPKGIDMKHEMNVKLSEYIPTYKNLKYIYDFGDDWQHDIEVEEIIEDYNQNHPVCLAGEGNTPPEDVGGIHGYELYLDILADPKHPDHKHMVEWGRSQFKQDFDIDMINRRLKN